MGKILHLFVVHDTGCCRKGVGYRPILISFVWTLTSYKGIWWLCKLHVPFLAETEKQNKNMLLFGLKPITFDSAVCLCINLSMKIIVKDDLKFMYL